MKILVTGFSSFPGVPVNPCEEVVAWIAENYSSTDVNTVILPVSYERSVERLMKCINQYSPDVIIEFGVSNRAKGLKIESMGYNARHAQIPDIDGRLCSCEIIDTSLAYDTIQRNGRLIQCVRIYEDIVHWKSIFPRIRTICVQQPVLAIDATYLTCRLFLFTFHQ